MIWGMVGRDPARGTIVPLYEPPDNMSPAAMRFLERMGFDEKAFTAAIMGLAAKGYLTIEQDESRTYKLASRKRPTDQNSNLSADEKSAVRILFEEGSALVLKNKNHELLSRARKAVENNLHATIETTSFRTNARYLLPGIIMSVLTIAAVDCSRIVFRVGRGRFVRWRRWWRRRRRLVIAADRGYSKSACMIGTICKCFYKNEKRQHPLAELRHISHVTAVTARSALLG
jgi:hypothetical protein